jgi:Holliday junction resolvase RusA-like endonuclease
VAPAIRFWVPGIPKALSVGKGIRVPNKGGGFRQFQTRTNTDWSLLVGQIGREHAPERPLEGAIAVTALFHVPRPQTASRRVVFPLKRPDIDNLIHKLTDHFNGVFWRDDSQVIDLVVRKRFGQDGRTGVEIVVEEITAVQVQAELEHAASA